MNLKVLLVEDSPDDAEMILRELGRIGYEVTHTQVASAVDLRDALDADIWEVLLCDYSMPGFSAEAALEILKGSALDIPFIIISGAITDDVAVLAMEAGASDYLMKDNLARLGPVISRELREVETRRGRRRAARAVRESEARFRAVLESSSDLIASLDTSGRIVSVNDAWCNALGYKAEEANGKRLEDFIAPDSVKSYSESIETAGRGNGASIPAITLTSKSDGGVSVQGNVIVGLGDGASQGSLVVLQKLAGDSAAAQVSAPQQSPAATVDQSADTGSRSVVTESDLLLVSDRLSFSGKLNQYFAEAGFEVTGAAGELEALRLAEEPRFEVVVIDMQLSGDVCINLCREIKSRTELPIVVFGPQGNELDETRAFQAGADDYVSESADSDEFLARVGSVIRRSSVGSGVEVGQRSHSDSVLQVDFVRRAVVVREKTVDLTATEFSLLEVLVKHVGQPFSALDLVRLIWGPEYNTEDLVRWHIRHLRQKIEENPERPTMITTRRGFGYQYSPPAS